MSGPIIVVDSSVAIKWVIPEHDSALAENLVGPYRLIAPHLIYAECANILWKKKRRGEISSLELMKAATVVDDFAAMTVSMRELVASAIDLSILLDHAVYDCFYLALSILQECPFVTADGKFQRKVHATLDRNQAEQCILLASFAV